MEQRRMMYRGGLSAGGKPTCRHSRTSRSFRNFSHRVRVYVHILSQMRCDRNTQPLPSMLRASYISRACLLTCFRVVAPVAVGGVAMEALSHDGAPVPSVWFGSVTYVGARNTQVR